MILAFHKPYGVLSQFTRETPAQRTLADFGFPPDVYPIGRLDADSEGLLLLSDEKSVTDQLLNPAHGHERTYWAQVEGIPTSQALEKLRKGGIQIKGHLTAPCSVRLLDTPPWTGERIPPIRYRAQIPTSWLELKLTEGKNRQVRRMTAAVGYPTLRLIRSAIGRYKLADLPEGKWLDLTPADHRALLSASAPVGKDFRQTTPRHTGRKKSPSSPATSARAGFSRTKQVKKASFPHNRPPMHEK